MKTPRYYVQEYGPRSFGINDRGQEKYGRWLELDVLYASRHEADIRCANLNAKDAESKGRKAS